MKLYFVRHGESTANIQMEFSNNGNKHPLTEKGVEQAHALARSLTGLRIRCIYSSPVLRARQTAQILAGHLQAPLEFAEPLREWSVGIYEGTTRLEGWKLHRQVQEDWFFHNKWENKMPGGESFLEIRARFVPFIESLIQAKQHQDQDLILVAHGGLYLAMLPVILKNISVELAMQHGFPHTACIVAEARTDGLWCIRWNDTPIK